MKYFLAGKENGNSVSKRIKITFLSAVLFGLITHMFALVNECPHADVFSAYFGYGAGYSSGRWGLAFLGNIVKKWFGNYPLPWLNGMCSILFLAASAVCIVETFEISAQWNCILISMFTMMCPAIFNTFVYIFTTPYYCFSIMLTCCGVYLVRKKKRGWILGIPLLTVSLGIYQAYLGLAASMFVLFLILDCLEESRDLGAVFLDAWKYLGILCGSVLLYLGITKVSLKLAGGVTLTSYESINTMGQLHIKQIPQFIIKAWFEFLAPAVTDRNGFSMFWAVRICYILLLAILAILALRLIAKAGKSGKRKMALMLLFLLLFPCGVNLIYLMCINGYVHTLMRYAQIMVYIAAIVILEKTGEALLKKAEMLKIRHLLTGICLITAGVFCIQANQMYFGVHQAFTQTKAYYTVLVTQIKSAKGYREGMPVAFAGEVNDRTFPSFAAYSKFKTMSGMDMANYYQIYSNKGLITYCCGFSPEYIDDTSEIEETEEYKEMPCYPDYGSIAVLDGVVVVKFR